MAYKRRFQSLIFHPPPPSIIPLILLFNIPSMALSPSHPKEGAKILIINKNLRKNQTNSKREQERDIFWGLKRR